VKEIEMNKTAIRKLVRAIYYRLIDRSQWPCVAAHVRDLKAELPDGELLRAVVKFERLFRAGVSADTIIAYNRVVSLLPPKTYGELTAGNHFSIPGYFEVIRKTKQGIEVGLHHVLYSHLPPNQQVL
jgi:hypothetical protein